MRQTILLLSLSTFLFFGCGDASVDEMAMDDARSAPRPRVGDMVVIPAGEFIMGSDEKPAFGPPLAVPERKETLPAFRIHVYEVTNGQFIKFQTEGDYVSEGDWRTYYSIGREDHPVANVTWDDARAFCEWAGGRLPTEAEWEKAARGPDGNPFPWGEGWDSSKANCSESGRRGPVEVGSFESDVSHYGVYDMFGNVQEWMGEKLAPYPGSPIRNDPIFRHGSMSLRGSSYALKGSSMFLWTRSAYPAKMQAGMGFRCVQDISEEEVQSLADWESSVQAANRWFRSHFLGLQFDRPVRLTAR